MRHRCAVQVKINRVQSCGHGLANVVHYLIGNAVKRIGRYVARRRSACPDRFNQMPAMLLRRCDKAANRNVDPRKRGCHARTAPVGGEGVACSESVPARQSGRKGVGFVLVTGDEDVQSKALIFLD